MASCQVNDGLHCSYCSSVYNDPRMLSCLHSFCLQCLSQMDIANNSIACPSCKLVSFLPVEGDVASLPVNLRLAFEVNQNVIFEKVLASPSKVCESCEDEESLSVAYCNDCNDLLCDDCWKVHKKQKLTKSHIILCLDELKKKPRGELRKMVGPSVDSIPNCQYHHNQKLSFYCHSDGCRVPVCVECAIYRHDKTRGHDVKEINGEAMYLKVITANLTVKTEELNGSKVNLEKVLRQIKETEQNIQTRKDEVDVYVRSKFNELRRAIKLQKRKLSEENTKIANSKLMRLSTQYDGIHRQVQSIDSCVSMTTSATDEYSTVQLLAVANTLHNRAKALQKQYNATQLGLVDSPSYDVNVDSDSLKQEIAECGKFFHRNADGTRCSAMLPRQTLGLDTTMDVKVVTRNSFGELIKANHDGLTKVKAKLLSGGMVINDDMAITDQGDGTFLVHVRSNSEGNHKLSIAVNGLDVQGSPFNLLIVPKRDYTGLNQQPVHTISGIGIPKPRYIAFAGNGDMYVTSDGDHRIHVYDRNGVEKTTLGSGKGSGRTQFDSPYGIDIHGDVVYVADYGNHRIQQMTTGGEFTRVYGWRGSGRGQFNGPHDVKFNPADGKVYVADTNNDRVQVFNPADWRTSHVIDGTVTNFSKPMGIAFDLSGNVCVSAYRTKAVMVFNTSGDLVRQFSVTCPTSIAVDAFGNYFISCDAKFTLFENMVVQVLDSNGTVLLTGKGTNYSGHGIALSPHGIAVSPHGIAVSPHDDGIWITNKDTNKVMKF